MEIKSEEVKSKSKSKNTGGWDNIEPSAEHNKTFEGQKVYTLEGLTNRNGLLSLVTLGPTSN